MKKYLLLILFGCFFSSGGFAQYKLVVTKHSDPDKNSIDQTAEQGDVFTYEGIDGRNVGMYDISTSSVYFENWYVLLGQDDTFGTVNCFSPQKTGYLNVNQSNIFNSSSLSPNSKYGSRGPCFISHSAFLIKDLESTSETKCMDELLYTGSNVDLKVGKWQYQLDTGGWEDLQEEVVNKFTGGITYRNYTSYPLILAPNSFLPNKNYSGLLSVRYTFNGANTNAATFTITKSPPSLISNTPKANDISCYGQTDGNFELEFNRDLEPNEKLFIRYQKWEGTGWGVQQFEANEVQQSQLVDRKYISKKNYSKGRYKVVYFTVIDSGNPSCVVESNVFEIFEPDVLSIGSINITDTSCEGKNDGAISIIPSGGSNTYEYAWSGPNDYSSTSQNISGLAVGNYSLLLTDAKNESCSKSFGPFVVDAVSTIPKVVSTIIFQPGTPPSYQSTGSISVNVEGGSGNYEYAWRKTGDLTYIGPNNASLTNLSPGEYNLVIDDANGCSSVLYSYLINEIPPLSIDFDAVAPNCEGETGRITAIGSGGTGEYSYSWSNGSTNQTINVATGTYTVTISDNRGTSISEDYILDYENELLTVTFSKTDILCKGNNSGAIDLTITGGSGSYTIDWLDSPTNTKDRSGLSIGNYVYFVSDGNCTITNDGQGIEITEPTSELDLVLNSKTNVTTRGGNDGEIVIEVSGGTAPYSFAWTGPNGFTSNEQNIVDLFAGDYQVTATDTNGCNIASEIITITEPGPLGITSLNATDVLCKGDATGRITAEVSGTPPFTFVWTKDGDPSFSAPNQADIVGLSEGTYNLELTDASGDPAVTTSVFVSEPSEVLSSNLTSIDVSCFKGDDGQITINALGGTGPYQFAIDDGLGFQDSNTFTDLSARAYTVTVQDNNGCLFETTVDIGQPDAITIDTANTSITDATTTGGSDGAIDLVVIGGTGGYEYEWSGPNVNGNTSQNLAGLVAGTYQVLVTDANGCTLNEEFTVGEPGPLAITNIQVTDVGCNGESSGSITTTVSGNGNITFEWRNVTTNSIISTAGKDLADLPSGIYTLTIADETANPPVTSEEIEITEPVILSAVIIPSEVTCFGGNDGRIQINVSGGTPPFTYSIDGINFQNSNQFNGLIAGSYDVTIRDTNNCDLTTTTVVTQPQELGIIVDQEKNLTAANTADGAIAITVFGGTAPYSYQWTSDNGFTSSDEDLSDLEGGTYTLVIRDANNSTVGDGCYFTQDFTIAEPGELLVGLTQTVFLDCYNDDFAELTANVEGGVAPYNYQWFIVENGSNNLLSENSGIIGDLTAGEYFVRVTDANSISVETSPFTISEPNPLEIKLDGKVDVLCNGESTGSIAISVTGGTAPYQYFWDNGATTEDLNGLPAGEYVLEVVDVNGCFTERGITIEAPADALRIVNGSLRNVSAYQANDGSIALDITGGTGSYSIVWTRLSNNANMGDTNSITNLSADIYQITITDANGCSITESYEIFQPDVVEETMIPPTCAGASDGSISILVNKGNGAFTYAWNTGETTRNLNGLSAGTYTVTISGFGDGPITRTYTLEDPLPLVVDLGEDRVLCDGQQLELDATVSDPSATYRWTSDNGFTSSNPTVGLTEKGNYSLEVESRTGCTAAGTIFIDVSTEKISAEFAVSSQVFVGEPLILVDISYPLPDTIEWILPEEATVIKNDNDEAELVFSVPGEYEIGIVTYRGPCTAQQIKKVLVLAKDGTVNEEEVEFNKKIVEDFVIFPNPTNGQFTTQINLTERGNISIRVFSFANNALIASHKARGESSYKISMDISGKPAGVYAIVLETPYGTSLRKMILK